MTEKEKLDSWVGKHISTFHKNNNTDIDKQIHCARFVSYVIDFHKEKKGGGEGNIQNRVNELAYKGINAYMIDKTVTTDTGIKPVGLKLIYVTNSTLTIKNNKITTIRAHKGSKAYRHIGFYLDGTIWHYENGSKVEKVVSYALGGSDIEHSKFMGRYAGTCKMCVSDLPVGYSVRSFDAAT